MVALVSHPTTNRIISFTHRYFMSRLTWNHPAVSIPVLLIILLTLCIPAAVTAADIATMTPLVTVPANNTSLADDGAQGTGVPLSRLEPQPVITLLNLESDQEIFPGPRSMAFGPRYIRLTSNLPTLLVLAACACLAVLAFILYRRRNAFTEPAGNGKTGPKTGL